jgi:limonene-1,2-epoxide hydrolase
MSMASKEMSENDLAAILKSAAQNNQKYEITGMLLHGQGRFIQVLEGDDTHVDGVMLKIKNDTRHSFVTILDRQVIHSRDFPNWSMGFHRVSDSEISSNPSFVDFFNTSFDLYKARIKIGTPLIMLKEFSKRLSI